MKTLAAAVALALLAGPAAPAEDSEMQKEPQAVTVPMKVEYKAAWLTWVASTTTCLNALGIDCDNADVAGYSGYAFHLCIHPELCPSGPTVLDYDRLAGTARILGRGTAQFTGESHHSQHKNERTTAACEAAFEFAKHEIKAGRPCVMNGAYVPEFAAVVGIKGDSYILSSFKGDGAPPLKFDEVEAPGGVYVLAFPTETVTPTPIGDQIAISAAIAAWENAPFGLYRYGEEAYDLWIESLEAKRADAAGCGYNSECYAEARRFARDFFERASARNPHASEQLAEVAALYGEVAAALGKVRDLFPFEGAEWGTKIDDEESIAAAVVELKKAKAAEARAVEILCEVVAMEWPKAKWE
ncbi:MAG: hypothetical protein ACYTAN_17675 [Planctomycetota bacterium]|jgi:hypothetical protein